MNKLFFVFKLKNSKKRVVLNSLVLSLIVSSSLYYTEMHSSFFQEKLAPFVDSKYDVKVTALINDSLMSEISNKSFVEGAVFALIADLKFNDKRVVGVLVDDISKLNMTNYKPTLVEGNLSGRIIVSQDLAAKLNLEVGDTVVVCPAYGNQCVAMSVSGIAKFPPIADIDAAVEYPEEFKKYYASRLPTHALFGEAYVKLKSGASDKYIRKISSIAVDVYHRDEKLRDLKQQVNVEKRSPFFIVYVFSWIFAAAIITFAESSVFTLNIRKFKFLCGFRYVGTQFVLYILPQIIVSAVAGLVVTKLIFGRISYESAELLTAYLFLVLISAYASAYIVMRGR